ncbi:MAG: sigma-70 family RNA polymerase sigma factor [Nocardioidaceae bacterium]
MTSSSSTTRGTDQPARLRALVARVTEQDVEAFSAVYRELADDVHRVAMQVTRDDGLAEDVMQEVFAHVWRESAKFDESRGSVRSWLRTVTRGRAIDRVRREEAWRRSRPAPPPRQRQDDQVIEAVIASQQRDHLQEVMTVLTERERAAIALAYFGENSYAQVAEQLGVSLPALKSRIRSGLARMRIHLEMERT